MRTSAIDCSLILGLGIALGVNPGCGEGAASTVSSTGDASTGATTAAASTMTALTEGPTTGTTGTTAITTATATTGTTGGDASTSGAGCRKHVVLMGYWPPTNEMLRQWSDHPSQNPGVWVGEDWGGHGFDVYAFFPEFPPDGDPTNDKIGDDGAVGSPDFDLRVDYQATSADFWRIVDAYEPVILVTTSRGGKIGWEIEAIEGGHGQDNPGDPAQDWASDKYGEVQHPTQDTIDPRSWTAITTYRQGKTLPTTLPVPQIFAAATALELTGVAVDETGTSGNFLSGFLGLHGVYYNLTAPHNVAAGHIHVGLGLPVASATALIEASLHAVLTAHPAASLECPGERRGGGASPGQGASIGPIGAARRVGWTTRM